MEWLKVLLGVIPGSAITLLITWLISRKKEKLTYAESLQKVINLLSEKYYSVLEEKIALLEERADWRVRQKEMEQSIERLCSEVERLKGILNRLTNIDNNETIHPTTISVDATRVRRAKKPTK